MTLTVISGTASQPLALAVQEALGLEPPECEVQRFPDSELRPVVGDVRDHDVYVVQSTGPAVNDHIVELMLLLDACRRAGAGRVTAVVPYFGYARQDRRGRPGESVGSRVIADALVSAGAQRLVVVDPHTVALEAICDAPMEMLTAVPVLAEALGSTIDDDTVIVAPDLGAAKLAERYATLLGGRPVAVVRKTRTSGESVRAHDVVGETDGRSAVIVDDMISTGGTVAEAARSLSERGTTVRAVVATHGLLVDGAVDRLIGCSARRVITTDSLPVGYRSGLDVEVTTIAGLLADAVNRLHRGADLADLHLHV